METGEETAAAGLPMCGERLANCTVCLSWINTISGSSADPGATHRFTVTDEDFKIF